MPINVNDLGMGGVNVDSNPLDLADAELTNSQNATLGRIKKRGSALIKRRGLERINQASLGAAILGGIEAPYQGTAAAPANGSGGGIINTGDPNLGTGVAPGGSTAVPGNPGSGGNQGNTSQSVGSSIFSPSPLFGGGRLVVTGISSGSDHALGFNVLPAGWGSAGITRVQDGVQLPLEVAPADQGITITESPSGMTMWRNFTIANGAGYFAHAPFNENGLESNPQLPSIVKISADGKTIQTIMPIPDNPSILSMASVPFHRVIVTALMTEYGNGDAIWIATWDEIRSGPSTGHYGRVLRLSGLDSGAYTLTEIFNTFTTLAGSLFNTTPTIPFCLEPFLGNTWVGTIRGTSTGSIPAAGMFRVNSTWPTGWELTRFISAGSTSWSDICCMKAYKGTLYVGYLNRSPSVANAVIASLDSAGNYTSPVLTGSAGTATSPVGFVSMEIFNGKLYASYSNAGVGAQIYVYDGTSWTIAFTPAAASYILFADGTNGIYAWNGTPLTTSKRCYFSPDGSTWTDVTGNFPATPVNMIFPFDQQ